jgi:hypothetical protein
MFNVRTAAMAVTATLAVLPLLAGVADAKPAGMATKVPVTGKVRDARSAAAARGNAFRAKLSIVRFQARHGRLFAIARLRGWLAGQRFVKTLRFRVSLVRTAQAAQAPEPPPAPLPPLPPGPSCAILHLNLAPLNINLLGLVIRTDEIQLRIDGLQGPGNLLGNLLCGLVGILNPPPAGLTAGQTARVLNAILALQRPAVAGGGR